MRNFIDEMEYDNVNGKGYAEKLINGLRKIRKSL